MKTINSHNIVWEEFEKCFWVVMILCCLEIQLQWLWRNFCMFNPVLWHRITARCNIISTKYFVALLVHIMSYWENSKTNQDLKLIRRVPRENEIVAMEFLASSECSRKYEPIPFLPPYLPISMHEIFLDLYRFINVS